MFDPGTMALIKGLMGSTGASNSILSPFAQIAQGASHGENKLDTQDAKGFSQLFGEHMGAKKDEALGRVDQKKSRLMGLFKMLAGGGLGC